MTRSLETAGSRRLAGTFILSLVLGLALLSPASAQPMPKIGACPSGYHHSGGYCAPSSTAGPAIAKTGQCPREYHASGQLLPRSERRASRRAPGWRLPDQLPCEWSVLPLEPVIIQRVIAAPNPSTELQPMPTKPLSRKLRSGK